MTSSRQITILHFCTCIDTGELGRGLKEVGFSGLGLVKQCHQKIKLERTKDTIAAASAVS